MSAESTDQQVDFSIVVPVYFNEGCIKGLVHGLEATVLSRRDRFGELIFVDDGSQDNSFAELMQVRQSSPYPVTVIKLTRNFGQAAAIIAGYKYARGRCVVTISADGQDPPELINQMLDAFFDDGYEIVISARAGRDESLYRILTSRFFYFLIRKLSFPAMPKEGFDFWLIGRRALAALFRNLDAAPTFFQGQLLWLGYRTKTIFYRRQPRIAGSSRFSFGKKFTAFLDSVMSYSFAPIRIMSLAGCGFALFGFVYAALILVDTLVSGNPVKGWAPLMIVVLVMGGIQMVMLGIVGEYLWRTLVQVRRRDSYIIESIHEAASIGVTHADK